MADAERSHAPVPWGKEIRMTLRRILIPLGAVAFAAAMSGQSLTDHAAAMAGASAGVAGGKVVSDALTRILGGAADQTGAAAAESPKTSKKPEKSTEAKPAGVSAMGHQQSAAAPSASARPAWRRSVGERPVLPESQPDYSSYRYADPAPLVSSAQLRSVATGASRADVIGSLGAPAARISMDDDGHFVEILEFSANGSRVGSVRCSDGRVESVNTAQP
jgi:hypothetical protein